MHNFLARYSVKVKVIGGFALILIILASVAVYVLVSSSHLEKEILKMVDVTIPLQKKAMLLKNYVDTSGSSLGFYLLGKEEQLWKEFEQNVDNAQKLLVEIKSDLNVFGLITAEQRQMDLQLMNDIEAYLAEYKAQKPLLKKVAMDYSFNMEGLKITLENLGPLVVSIMSEIEKMKASEDEEEYDLERKHILVSINNLHILALRLANELRLYLSFRFPSSLISIDDRKLQIQALLNKFNVYLDAGELTLEQEESIAVIQKDFAQYFVTLDKVVTVHSGEQWRKDTYIVRQVISPLIDKINAKIDVFVATKTSDLTSESTQILKDVSDSSRLVSLISLIGIMLGILISWFITLHIVKRMNTAVDALYNIAEGGGNLKTRLDEVGHDEMSLLSKSFNKFVTKIGHIVDLVIQSSISLSGEAARMLDVTTETQKGVVKQQEEISSISVAIQEMTNTVDHIANNSSQAALTASEATEKAQNGQKVVAESVETIHKLALEVENAVDVIKRVDKESEDISIVVSVISDISEQTNLLALNAAIEAARAGEHGRGFAVVADEVRNLSNKIQSQTTLIIERIERLQLGARDAVKVMTHGFETAKNSVKLSNETGDALQIITESVINIASVSTSIAQSTEIQSKVANDILKNISVISGIAEKTSLGAMATKQSATEFRSMSAQLQGLVEQFLLDESSGVLDESLDGGVKIGENQEDDDIFF